MARRENHIKLTLTTALISDSLHNFVFTNQNLKIIIFLHNLVFTTFSKPFFIICWCFDTFGLKFTLYKTSDNAKLHFLCFVLLSIIFLRVSLQNVRRDSTTICFVLLGCFCRNINQNICYQFECLKIFIKALINNV